jgi:hypothetical protein
MGNVPSHDIVMVRKDTIAHLERVQGLMKYHPRLAHALRGNFEQLRTYIERAFTVNQLYEWDVVIYTVERIVRECIDGTYRPPVPKKPWYAIFIPTPSGIRSESLVQRTR